MQIKITKTIERSVLEDTIVTALEGGSNYWYYLPDHSCYSIRKAVPKEIDPCLSTAFVKALLDYGLHIRINGVIFS